MEAEMQKKLEALMSKWDAEQKQYPRTPEGNAAAAAVYLCIDELAAALLASSSGQQAPQPVPAVVYVLTKVELGGNDHYDFQGVFPTLEAAKAEAARCKPVAEWHQEDDEPDAWRSPEEGYGYRRIDAHHFALSAPQPAPDAALREGEVNWAAFSLRDEVLVELSRYGKAVHERHYENLRSRSVLPPTYETPLPCSSGEYAFTLASLLAIFGAHISEFQPNPFSGDIRLRHVHQEARAALGQEQGE